MVELSKHREIFHNRRILLAYSLCAVLTAAITATLTPTTVNRAEGYTLGIPSANYGPYINISSRPCAGTAVTSEEQQILSNATSQFLHWKFPNGSWFYSTWGGSGCPQSRAIALASGINSQNPADYAYVDSGVAVDSTAIGAPAIIYTGPEFQNVSIQYGAYLMQTTQCVPVMTSNPVQCKTGGEVKVTNSVRNTSTGVYNGLGVYIQSSFNANDNYTTPPFVSRDPRTDAVMAKRMFANVTGEVGSITMVFGAVTDFKGTAYAADLAQAINDPNATSYETGNSTYVVTCIMNSQNAYNYRWVALQQRTTEKIKTSGYSFHLLGGDDCTPLNPTVSDVLFATAATANWNTVMENFGLDGYFSTINRAVGRNRGPPYAFSNSRNALEDVLGLIAAMVTANLNTTDGAVAADAIGPNGNGQAIIQATRLGNDNPWLLWLLFPPLSCATIIGLLLRKSCKHHWMPGGDASKGSSMKELPKFYAGESVSELFSIGRDAELQAYSMPLISGRD